jgi:hypothetical protein
MLTRIKLWLAAIGAALVALLGIVAKAKHDGRKQERQTQKEKDYAQADRVRDRVANRKRVHPDDIKFRD